MNKIKTAIVGFGMGSYHAMHYIKHPGADLVAVAEVDRSRHRAILEMLPKARAYGDFREMLKEEKPDLVSVAVPNFLHEEVCVAALDAGAHVLCEKPMSVDVESAMRMRDHADSSGRSLFINFSQRFGAFAQTARELVDTGALGHIYHAYCQWTRRKGIPRFGGWFGQKDKSGGGPLIDLGVHRLDLVLWLMGKVKPVSVSGVTHSHLGAPRAQAEGKEFDVEDFASGFIRVDSGASILFEVSWDGFQSRGEQQVLRIMGDQGAIEEQPAEKGDSPLRYCHDVAGLPMVSTPLSMKGATSSYEELITCLLDGTPFPSTAEDGIRLQIVLDCLYESARTGREIQVEDFAGAALYYL